jgi:hypothetical protein
MMHGTYIGLTAITAFGCCRCQREHRKGMDAEYESHLMHQSKHGYYRRAPLTMAEWFSALMQTDERSWPRGDI